MKNLENINKSFKTARLTLIIIVVLSLVLNGYVVYTTLDMVGKEREKIYVLDNGNTLQLALSKNSAANRVFELKNHLKMFHNLFFDLDPDPNAIKIQIKNALNLIDNSGKLKNSIREENMFYHKLVDGNMSSKIHVDSINVYMKEKPYRAVYFAKQKIIRQSKVVFKNLITSCSFREVKRSDDNPHGFLIENYEILDNSIIQESER